MTDHVPSNDVGLWLVARDDFEAVIARLDSTEDELDAAGDVKATIAARIRSTPALTFADIVPKLAILKDCYRSITDLAEAVTGRNCDCTRLAGDMALSICWDLMTLTAAPAH